MAYVEKLEHDKVLDLKEIVPIEEEQMLPKTLVQRGDLGMTIFSLDKGQEIGRYSSLGDTIVNVLSGAAEIAIVDDDYIVKVGESIAMSVEVPHTLYAGEVFRMLLTVVKPEAKHD